MAYTGGSSPLGPHHNDQPVTASASHILRHQFAATNKSTDFGPSAGIFRDNDNLPDRFELFHREEGEKMVDTDTDTRVPNCSIFHFHKEDHTLGNLLKYQLHKNPHVWFSGYKVPHPLFAEFDLRVQTDGTLTPKEALTQACKELIRDCSTLEREFTKEFELHRMKNLGQDGLGGAGAGASAGPSKF